MPLLSRAVLLAMTLGFAASHVAAESVPAAPAHYSSPPVLTYAELRSLLEAEPGSEASLAKLERVLGTAVVSNEAYYAGARPHRPVTARGPGLRVGFWNLAHGLNARMAQRALANPESFEVFLRGEGLAEDAAARAAEEAVALGAADILVLTEADAGGERTEYRDVTRDLAHHLKMNYAFAVEFIELQPLLAPSRALGHPPLDEVRYRGLHGMAVLSRYPILEARVVPYEDQPYDWFWHEKRGPSQLERGRRTLGKWAFANAERDEVRFGGRRMLVVELAVPDVEEGRVTVVVTQLENKTTPQRRREQMRELLATVRPIAHPVIVAGDLNTTGRDYTPTSWMYQIQSRVRSRDFWARLGVKVVTEVGLAADVLLGGLWLARTQNDPTVDNVKLLAPNRERNLFQMVEKTRFDDGHTFDFRGDRERSSNERRGTLANSNERARKGFVPTFALERTYGPFGHFKLDWFFVKAYLEHPRDKAGSYKMAPHNGRTLRALNYSVRGRMSDHSPMMVDLPFEEPARAPLPLVKTSPRNGSAQTD